jgi:hypothetical protein
MAVVPDSVQRKAIHMKRQTHINLGKAIPDIIARSCFLVLFIALALAGSVFAQSYKLKAPFATQPVLLTSVGQSADVEMVKVLLNRSKIAFTINAQAKAGEIPGDAKTLILAIGGSSKGLGAAGIAAEAEMERVKVLVADARKKGMKIIGVHVGGEARRGELSDKFIQLAVPLCDYVVIVAEGNKDGLFTKLCGTKIPLDAVDKIALAGAPLAAAFLK